MSRSFTFALLFVVFTAVSTSASTAIAGENDLFSKVRTKSVFQTSTENSTSKTTESSSSKKPTPIAGIGHLGDLTREAGFETKKISARSISTKVQVGQWSIPVVLTISADKSQISVALLLSTLKTGDELPTQQLLSLLNANRTYAPSFFAYSTKQKRTELHQIVKNEDVTSAILEKTIKNLGETAGKTTGLWQIDAANSLAPAPTKAAPVDSTPVVVQKLVSPPTATSPDSASSLTLEGKWSAVRSKTEAFAIQLNRDKSFVLVYVNNGKQNRSTGKFTLIGQSLTLSGDSGNPLKATISSQSATEFHLLMENAAETAKLIFKKSL